MFLCLRSAHRCIRVALPLLLMLLSACVVPSMVSAQSVDLFTPGATLQVASSANVPLIGDMNGDTIDDLVAVDRYGRKVDVWLGQPDGSFVLSTSTATAGQPVSGTLFQANGDGAVDVVVCLEPPDNKIQVLTGNGSGGLTAGTPVATMYPGTSYAAPGDFDGDGDQDLAVSMNGTGVNTAHHVFYENTGTDWVARCDQFIGDRTGPMGVTVADVDHDGDLDAIMALTNGRSIRVIFNDGNWACHTGPAIPTPSLYALGPLAQGDFNEDGNVDVASVNNNSHGYAVFLGNGAGGFTAADWSVAGWNLPGGLAVGDFDRDCHQDLVVTDYGAGKFYVLHGRGTGLFDIYPTTYTAAGAGWPAISDFNRDGVLDLAVGCTDGNVRLQVGQPVVYFTDGGTNSVSDNNIILAVGDVNGDGKLDYVACDRFHQKLQTWLGTGSGNFTLASLMITPGNPLGSTLADVNGDGDLDLAVQLENPVNKRLIYLGDGYGNFCLLQVMSVSGGPMSIEPGDLDADGDVDLATSYVRQSDNMAVVEILQNNGGGVFAPCFSYPIGDRTSLKNVVIADFDSDGDPDVAAATTNGRSVTVLFNNGNCDFTPGPAWSPPTLYALNGITGGDLDGDGDTDLIALNNNSHGYAVYLNKGDGTFIVHDRVEPSWALPSIAAIGDFDHDCVADFLACDYGNGKAYLMDGFGNGQFRLLDLSYDVPAASIPSIGDFNGDNVPDVLVACANGSATLLLGTTDQWPTGVPEPSTPGVGSAESGLHVVPNPGSMARRLFFALPEAGPVEIRIVDVAGRLLATLQNGPLPAGTHELTWDGETIGGQPLASGVYYAEMRTASKVSRRAITVIH